MGFSILYIYFSCFLLYLVPIYSGPIDGNISSEGPLLISSRHIHLTEPVGHDFDTVNNICSICLDGDIPVDVKLRCPGSVHHPFHLQCITQWLDEKRICPYCQQVPCGSRWTNFTLSTINLDNIVAALTMDFRDFVDRRNTPTLLDRVLISTSCLVAVKLSLLITLELLNRSLENAQIDMYYRSIIYNFVIGTFGLWHTITVLLLVILFAN